MPVGQTALQAWQLRQVYDGAGIFTAVVEIGEDEPDGPDVDMTVVVPADKLVDGADIGASAAADAAERLGEERVAGQRQATVIQEDDVHLLAAVRRGGASRGAGDPGHVGRNELAGGVARKHLEDAQGALEVGQQLVKADQRHVNAGQRGHQPPVALVGDESDRSRLGDGEIGPGDAHVGLEESLAELPPGHFDHAVDVFGVLNLAGDLREELGDLLAGEMNGRHDHVRRAFMPELDDPFAEVGFGYDKTFFFQVVVEEGFFRGHGLALDDFLDAVGPGNIGNDGVGLKGGAGNVHLDAGRFRTGFEGGEELLE